MNEEIYQYVISLLQEKAPLPSDVKDDLMSLRFLDHGYIDSIGIMEFILKLEEKFAVRFSPEDTESDEFRYVEGLVKMVEGKME